MRLTDDALARHVYVLGASGVGKSRGLEGWAVQLMRSDEGIGVLDPHGELYNNLLARIAKQGKRIWDRVVLIDPLDPDYTVSFNPLELFPGDIPERKANFLAGVITKIFKADPIITARMQRMLFHTFWLLSLFNLTLVEFERVLRERDFRAQYLQRLPLNHGLRGYWEHEFPKNERIVNEWTQSSLNKVGPLVADPDVALILGQKKSTINFRRIMDEGKILLVNLPKGRLTENTSQLLGAFVLAQIQLAALSRAQKQGAYRRFTLFLDEFQTYATDDIHEILSESRKYKLSLVLAHQYYAQLRDQPKLQAAVVATVGNFVCFQIGSEDAELLGRDIFMPEVDQVKDIRYRRVPTGFSLIPFTTEEEMVWRPLPEIWELEMRRLTRLGDRQFWYKRKGPDSPQLLRTLTLPDIALTSELERSIDQVRGVSARNYGRPKPQQNHFRYLDSDDDVDRPIEIYDRLP